MAYIRRRVGVVFLALVTSVLLSACGSQEVKLDHQINTPTLATRSLQDSPLTQAEPFVLEDQAAFSSTGQQSDGTSSLIKFVASRFKKPEALISKVVIAAQKYSKPDFPTTKDLLAIIAVESTYDMDAHHRGSWGLMQIEAKSHRAKFKGENLKNIDTNIRVGSEILQQYYDITKSKNGAIVAYNVGIGNYLAGRRNPAYLRKVNTQKAVLANV